MTVAAVSGWGVALFPLVAAVVAVAFSAVLARRYVDRRRPAEGLWALAMLMYAAASTAAFVGVGAGWTPLAYRVFWLFGVALNVPFLAAGEAYLLAARPRRAAIVLGVVLALSALSLVVVFGADVDPEALRATLPRGIEVWGSGAPPYALRYLSWAGYLFLLGGLVWSARLMQRDPALRARAGALLAIALGATLVFVGSGVGAGFEIVPIFAVGIAAGISVMFWGFLRAIRPAAAPVRSTAEPA